MRRNDQPSRPNAMTCSRLSLLKTWLMTTEAKFPLQQICLKPSLYGRFSLDHLWPLLGDHRGQLTIPAPRQSSVASRDLLCIVALKAPAVSPRKYKNESSHTIREGVWRFEPYSC